MKHERYRQLKFILKMCSIEFLYACYNRDIYDDESPKTNQPSLYKAISQTMQINNPETFTSDILRLKQTSQLSPSDTQKNHNFIPLCHVPLNNLSGINRISCINIVTVSITHSLNPITHTSTAHQHSATVSITRFNILRH